MTATTYPVYDGLGAPTIPKWRTIVTDHWLSHCIEDLLALHIWFQVEPRDQDKSFYLTVHEEDKERVQEVLR